MTTAIQEIPIKRINGDGATLGDFNGQVLLVVNVASKCGLTPQYTALESVFEANRDRGFTVLAFPANDFGAQEPGTNEEIRQFCETKFNTEFPLFAKIAVTGEETHPLYRALIDAQPAAIATPDTDFRGRLKGYGIEPNPEPGILWNFEKFLISRKGEVVARFNPDVTPDSPVVAEAIEAELAKPG